METKKLDLRLEVKEISDEGKFVGLASTYDNVDLGGDVVRPGAFTKTLKERKQVPILFQHDPTKVIGVGTLRDTKDGLVVEGELDVDIDPLASLTHQKMKRGRFDGLSIGFTVVKDAIKEKVRELFEVKLWEISITPFPMNPLATVTDVKESALTPQPEATPDPEPAEPEEKAATESIEPSIHSLLKFLKEN